MARASLTQLPRIEGPADLILELAYNDPKCSGSCQTSWSRSIHDPALLARHAGVYHVCGGRGSLAGQSPGRRDTAIISLTFGHRFALQTAASWTDKVASCMNGDSISKCSD